MHGWARPIAARAVLIAAVLAACWSAPAAEKRSAQTATRLPPVSHSSRAPSPNPEHGARPDESQPFVTPERLERGYTIVVVGVNGDNSLSAGLAPGLVDGGYPGAVEVVDWTTGHWPLFIYHLRAASRHRAGARAIAEKITAYQARYPRREVNLVGYSAGAVVAIEAVEKLAPGQTLERVVLLAGAISPLHDLRPALARTSVGIWSYYQPQDVVALWAGTLLVGTADGQHIVSAGAVGFWPPPKMSDAERALYHDKLVQLPFQPQMIQSGNLGGHFQCVGRRFVAEWISPVLTSGPKTAVARGRGRRIE